MTSPDPKHAGQLDRLHHLLTADALAVRALTLGDDTPRAMVVPEGWTVEQLNPSRWDHLREGPRHLKARRLFRDPAAFVEYVSARAGAGTTVWLHDQSTVPRSAAEGRQLAAGLGLVVTAVLDDHRPSGLTGWGHHVAELVLEPTAEWQRLLALSAAGSMGQAAMADRLEALEHVFAGDWSGAKLLDLLDSLEGTSTYAVKAVDPLGSTTRVTIDAGQKVVGAGGLQIPRQLELVVQPFRHLTVPDEGRPFAVAMRARLTARIANGEGLGLAFALRNPEAVTEAAERVLVDYLDAALTVAPVWHGHPGALAHPGVLGE